MRYKVWMEVNAFTNRYSIVLQHLLKTVSVTLCLCGKSDDWMYVGLFGTVSSIPCFLCLSRHQCLLFSLLSSYNESCNQVMQVSQFFFFFKVVLTILASLNLHFNFTITLSVSTKKKKKRHAWSLNDVAFKLQINLRSVELLTILSLSIHNHCIFFHIIKSFTFLLDWSIFIYFYAIVRSISQLQFLLIHG